MTVTITDTGSEAILLVEVEWSTGTILYADRNIPANGAIGRILEASNISATGKLGSSGVTKTLSVTLDDVDGSLKTIVDTAILEGTQCTVSNYLINNVGAPQTQFVFSGRISSDIQWSEGERTLSFSIEEGDQSGNSREIGYAPVEGAYLALNPSAVGVNWPIVFGTALKVPAVRVEYLDDITLENNYTYANGSYELANGDQLPQGTPISLSIDRIIFTGTMSGKTFTPSTKNDPKFVNVDFAVRPGGDPDEGSSNTAWLPIGSGNYVGLYLIVNHTAYGWMVNFCIAQTGLKITFVDVWDGFALMDNNQTIEEAARWPRTGWAKTYEKQSDTGATVLVSIALDGWTIKSGAPVVYDSGNPYEDRYIANLYPSSTIHEVWGKRKFYGKEIWAQIPSSYYVIGLSTLITTAPGAIARNVTTIDFGVKLSDIECENWSDAVYVTLTSTLSNVPKTIIAWVTANFTSYGFNASSDSPAVSMNFAYFQTTDALAFIQELAYQCASTIVISNGIITLIQSSKVPGTGVAGLQTVGMTDVRMKSLTMGFRATEENNTISEGAYVTDYSGDDDSSHIYRKEENTTVLGNNTSSHDMFALTCLVAVASVIDFWAYRRGNSWKILNYDCFLKASDFNVFDGITHNLAPSLPDGTIGVIEKVEHDTSNDLVKIQVALPIKSGANITDPNFWVLGPATCTPTVGAQLDYTPPPDDSCAVYSSVQSTTSTRYKVVLTAWAPFIVRRWTFFQITLETRDMDGNPVAIDYTARVRLYTSSITDCFYDFPVMPFIAGTVTILNIMIRRSTFPGILRIFVNPNDKRIKPTEITEVERPK